MWPSRKAFATLSALNSSSDTVQHTVTSLQNIWQTLLPQIILSNCKSPLLRQHTVNKTLLSIYVYISTALGRVLTKHVALL
jgi:hypothetical protein